MVTAVRNPKSAVSIELHGVRCTEFAVAHADLTPLPNEGTVRRKFHNAGGIAGSAAFFHGLIAGHALTIVAVRHIDAAIWSDNHIIRLVKGIWSSPGLTRSSETHQ